MVLRPGHRVLLVGPPLPIANWSANSFLATACLFGATAMPSSRRAFLRTLAAGIATALDSLVPRRAYALSENDLAKIWKYADRDERRAIRREIDSTQAFNLKMLDLDSFLNDMEREFISTVMDRKLDFLKTYRYGVIDVSTIYYIGSGALPMGRFNRQAVETQISDHINGRGFAYAHTIWARRIGERMGSMAATLFGDQPTAVVIAQGLLETPFGRSLFIGHLSRVEHPQNRNERELYFEDSLQRQLIMYQCGI